MISHEDTPNERLSTTSSTGSRIYLFPADVKGKLRALRNHIYDVLIIIFLILPWVRIQGEPVLLFDIPHRKFHIFGLSFWGHEAPLLFLVLLITIATILLLTALFGRLWCGWACPQTVFIDRVFRRIERWVEGSANRRKKLAASPWTVEKFTKRSIKWFLYLIASMIITHSFLAYFVGSERIFDMIRHHPAENPQSFLVIVITTALVLFDFGWFREQFCIIACPYGRFQSVLMDEHSLIVAYDEKRGEPRKKKGVKSEDQGDCVSCQRCVQVCPTGIDIRHGVQMECIGCTACIDACNTVMQKINKPEGLIRYDTEKGLEGQPKKTIRLRVILYTLILSAALIILSFLVSHRNLLKVNIVRSKNTPFQVIDEGKRVINHFKLNVRNQHDTPVNVNFVVASEYDKGGNIELTMPVSPLRLEPQSSSRNDLFVFFDASIISLEKTILPIEAQVVPEGAEQEPPATHKYEVPLIAPMSSTR